MSKTDETDQERRIERLEKEVDGLRGMLSRASMSRREVLALGAAGVAGAAGFGAGSASAGGDRTQWGTDENRDDYVIHDLDAVNAAVEDNVDVGGEIRDGDGTTRVEPRGTSTRIYNHEGVEGIRVAGAATTIYRPDTGLQGVRVDGANNGPMLSYEFVGGTLVRDENGGFDAVRYDADGTGPPGKVVVEGATLDMEENDLEGLRRVIPSGENPFYIQTDSASSETYLAINFDTGDVSIGKGEASPARPVDLAGNTRVQGDLDVDGDLDVSGKVTSVDAGDLEGDAKMDDVLSTDGTDAYWTDPDSLLEGQESEIAVPALNYTEADSSFDSTGWLENTTGLPMEVRVVIDIDHGLFQSDLTFGGMATFHVNDSEQDNPILRRPFYFDGDRPVYNDTEDWEETLYYTVPSGKHFRTVVDHDADDPDFWVNLTTYTSEWVTE